MGVRPEARRQGLATALLTEAEERLRALGATEMAVGALGPNFFEPGVEPQQTDLVALLLKRGYNTDRVSRVNMDVRVQEANLETATDEARLAAEGIIIRRATLVDVEATAQFALDNFSESWRYETWQAARFDPHPLFVALEGERIIAFACYDVTGMNWFGPTGTHPDYRQRGIGGVLLKLCLRSIRERGGTLAEIIWAGPLHYYAHSVNARIRRGFWLFRKPLVEQAEISA
jgi:GNAT superfamily N-acetyltransferase